MPSCASRPPIARSTAAGTSRSRPRRLRSCGVSWRARSCAGGKWSSRPVCWGRSDICRERQRGEATMRVFRSLVFATALIASPAAAQDYPTKPVTIVGPFAAGGAGDILGRLISPHMEKRLGKPFIVENRVGAGGVIGATSFRKAPPDGHSIMIAPSPTMAVNVTLYQKLPYDPVSDFIPLAMAAGTPFVLVVNPSLPVKTVANLIAYVKARPGKLSYGTAGAGVPHHLFMELLKSKTGLDMSPVAYKGGAPAIADVVAGHIPL